MRARRGNKLSEQTLRSSHGKSPARGDRLTIARASSPRYTAVSPRVRPRANLQTPNRNSRGVRSSSGGNIHAKARARGSLHGGVTSVKLRDRFTGTCAVRVWRKTGEGGGGQKKKQPRGLCGARLLEAGPRGNGSLTKLRRRR